MRGATPSPDLRRADRARAVAAVAAAAVALTSGLRPTGGRTVDIVLVAVATAFAGFAGASAPWWALAGAATLVAATAPTWVGTALAGVALVGALAAGGLGRDLPELDAVVGVAVVGALCHLGPRPLGIPSAVAGPALAVAVTILGIRNWPAHQRRIARYAAGVSGTAIVLGVATSAIGAGAAAADLREGNRSVHQALAAVDRGDIEAARGSFDDAAVALTDADAHLGAWWTAPGALVPVLAQHRATGSAVAGAAADALGRAAVVLAAVDPAALQLRDSTVDLDAIAALDGPLAELDTSAATLSATLRAADSPWLVGPVTERLGDLRARLEDSRAVLSQLRKALAIAPAMLGGDGERRYLVGFLNPAEARGLGGHMGNYAELTVRDGKIELTRFGRSVGLNRRVPDPDGRVVTGPAEFLARWGRFGYLQPDGTTDVMPWSNITMPPDLPMVATVAAELYPQSGGAPLDGVVTLLPEALAVLMRVTGPVRLAEFDRNVGADDLARFITREQYDLYAGEHVERVDALETIAETTFQRLLGGGKGRALNIVGDLRALRATAGVALWSRHADEEAYFTELGIDGAFPALDGHDGIAVTVDNGGANKLDTYLDVSTVYRSRPGPAGTTAATVTITVANTVDPAGKPDYAVGNLVGLPRGTNRTMLSVYSALPARAMALDGNPVTVDGRTAEIAPAPTFGWRTSAIWVDVPPGATRVVTVELAGVLTGITGDADVVVRRQPMPIPQRYDIVAG